MKRNGKFSNEFAVLNTGLSPRGKATDFDSVIPLVRIQPAQPEIPDAAASGVFDFFAIDANYLILEFCAVFSLQISLEYVII